MLLASSVDPAPHFAVPLIRRGAGFYLPTARVFLTRRLCLMAVSV
jgi:hypothetical protein